MHQDVWKQKFAEHLDLVHRDAVVHWTATSVSGYRDVFHPLLLLLHKGAGPTAKFSKCELWRRRGVARTVAALGRLDFRDWTKALDLADRGHLDGSADKRQQLSGLAAALVCDDGVCHCQWLLLSFAQRPLTSLDVA
jgi:hypothetical protein